MTTEPKPASARPLKSYFWRSFFVSGVLAFLILLVIVTHPRALWDFFAPRVLPAGLTVTWQDLKVSFRPVGGLNSRIVIDVKGFAVNRADPVLRLPASELRLDASLLPFEAHKVAVHDLVIDVPSTIQVELPEPAAPGDLPQPEQSFFESLRTPLRLTAKLFANVRFEKSSVRIAGLEARRSKEVFVRGRFTEKSVSEEKGIHVDLALDRVAGKEAVLQIKADPVVEQGPVHVVFKVLAKLFGVAATQNADLRWGGSEVQFVTSGPLAYRANGLNLSGKPVLRVKADPKAVVVGLETALEGVPGPVPRVDKITFDFNLPLASEQTWVDRPADYRLLVNVDPLRKNPAVRANIAKATGEKIPAVLTAELSGQAWLARLVGESDAAKLVTAKFRVVNLNHPMLSWNGSLNASVYQRERGYELRPSADVVVRSARFQHLVKFLDAENILVPAPLDVLDGPTELTITGLEDESKPDTAGLDVKMKTNLASKKQVVNLRMESKPTLDATWTILDVPVKLIVDQLRLELPPLDPLWGLPRIVPDSRVQRKPAAVNPKASKFQVRFAFDVETPTPGSIRLLTKFADPAVLATVKVRREQARTDGLIQLEPFDVNYLRRQLHVEKLRITLDDIEKGVLPIDARFGLKQGIYDIKIIATGPIKNPNIDFTSKPYLSRDEIISVLLYGRTSDQLVSADAATAGSVQAAMADRAIGLLGLWAFATTPIKSFSYNAVTKTYAATVALSDDLSAQVGTNWEETTQLQLRQRLSTRWAVTAAWTPASSTEEETRKLVLQWEQRF